LRRRKAQPATPHIIRNEAIDTKPMSAEEAALELELFKREFLIFRDANTDKINVIYKREDGNYGLIEP
jgi:putative sigma-54 modulation protein